MIPGGDRRIPITLLTGFLGAGKTTVVNQVLSEPAGVRTAVIVNEFGEIGIDGALISRASEDMLELSNGCICCSGKDDLLGTLYKLYMRKAGLAEPKTEFDRVLIETTGLANPLPLAQALYTDMSLSLTYRLDAIVTLVDVKHVTLQLRDAPEAERQIALADKIVMNKLDLASDDEYRRARDRVQQLNPLAPRQVVSFGKLASQDLFDIGLFDPDTSAAGLRRWIGHDNPRAQGAHLGKSEPHVHDARCRHDEEVSSVSIRESRAVDYDKLMRFLLNLTRSHGTRLYRVKGLIRFGGDDRPVVLQGVQNVFSPLAYADAWPDGTSETRLVIIGKGLVRDALVSDFSACIADDIPGIDQVHGMI